MHKFLWFIILFPVARLTQAQDVASLPGTYEAVQRISASSLAEQKIGIKGKHGEGPGTIGDPVVGSLVLNEDKTFSISMAYADEGQWEVQRDDEQNIPFLHLKGAQSAIDGMFQGEYGLRPGALGIWMQEGSEWYLIEFRKAAAPGETVFDPYGATEAAMAGMFGQGDIEVSEAEVAQGSATGCKILKGAFSKNARFASSGAETDDESRLVLTFLMDQRFTVQSTGNNTSRNGKYQVAGTELRLRLAGAAEDDIWEIGRDKISGKFAIRPRGETNFFLEIPQQ